MSVTNCIYVEIHNNHFQAWFLHSIVASLLFKRYFGILWRSFSIDDVSGVMENVYCIQVCARARRQGTPDPTRITPFLRQTVGGTIDDGDPFVVSSGLFKTGYYIWQTNPYVGGSWTPAQVDNLLIGVLSTDPA